ncbi:IS30 family transposase [Streptomyces roseus]|uniref:IS30 family transposase n=1 Tax=Streptomyces roseus TaxID=66430 RepID=UPI00382E80CC
MFEIRKDRTKDLGGRRRLVREREEYFRLVDQGYGNTEACRLVGINERTGREWRNGRRAEDRFGPPARPASAPVAPSRFLTQADRLHVADRLREKATVRAIAAELSRSPSTISREIRHNCIPLRGDTSRWVYRPYAAQARSDGRRPRLRPGRISQNSQLRDYIQERLTRCWSPEQIAAQLPRHFPDDLEMRVTHETIYQALYVQGRGELRRELVHALRTSRPRHKPHRHAARRQARFGTPMVMISERPAEVADRAIPGHWEGDLIVGPGPGLPSGRWWNSTRYLMLLHLPDGAHKAGHFHEVLARTIQTLPSQCKHSLRQAVFGITGQPLKGVAEGLAWAGRSGG